MNTIPANTSSNSLPKWGALERSQWLAQQSVKRSYQFEVVNKIEQLKQNFEVSQYGALEYDVQKYPLYLIKNRHWDDQLPVILITGGVHGYETSGVQGAIRFLKTQAYQYKGQFNFIVAPCISPWGYETINRWNPYCVDPNRSFYQALINGELSTQQGSEEANKFMQAISAISNNVYAHIDLHETTDSDNNEFIPALNARDGKQPEPRETPDGFYLVGDTDNSQDECMAFIIEGVEKVTHIAPADNQGCIIGSPLSQRGVINYALESLGLCAGVTKAKYRITTEVYPDSPKATDEICINAQVASVMSLLEYLK